MKVLLSLSATETLYHFTNTRAAIKALEGGMLLSPVAMTGADTALSKKHLYFLSMTRSRHGRYHRNDEQGVLFEIDGRKANQKFKIKPVDYWQFFSSPRVRADSDEQEERLVTSVPKIDIKPYLKSISLLVRDKTDKFTVRLLNLHARKLGIPFYVYNDPKLFKAGREKGRLNIGAVVDLNAKAPKMHDSGRATEPLLSSALHVLNLMKDPEFDTYDAIYDVKGLDRSFIGNLRYGDSLQRQLEAAFQNAGRAAGMGRLKDRERLDRLLAAMAKLGLRTAKDYADYIMARREADRQKINAKRAAENPQADDGW